MDLSDLNLNGSDLSNGDLRRTNSRHRDVIHLDEAFL